MSILLYGYVLPTCVCLSILYYVFKFWAEEGDGEKLLHLTLLSFVPVVNIVGLLMLALASLADYFVVLIEKQLKKRKIKTKGE